MTTAAFQPFPDGEDDREPLPAHDVVVEIVEYRADGQIEYRSPNGQTHRTHVRYVRIKATR
jgi:hypothetical protein